MLIAVTKYYLTAILFLTILDTPLSKDKSTRMATGFVFLSPERALC